MSNTASLKKEYAERIAPALKNQFQCRFLFLKRLLSIRDWEWL